MSDDSDKYDDLFDKIKKHFKFNSDLFDIEFFVFPENVPNRDSKFPRNKEKGFKISYHFEKGMDKPEVNIEGDVDKDELKKYLDRINLKTHPQFRKMMKAQKEKKKEINAKDLDLEPTQQPNKTRVSATEPFSEITAMEDSVEVIFEVPGIEVNDIVVSLDRDGRKLSFTAINEDHNYYKQEILPFQTSIDKYDIEVNNGIAVLQFNRKYE